jgi:Lar family restriction alleviation protein
MRVLLYSVCTVILQVINMVGMIEIDKCPFCGYGASVKVDHDSNGNEYCLVECDGCTALGPASEAYLSYETNIDIEKEKVSAIENWNKRNKGT